MIKRHANTLRIIGGQWRRRLIRFPDLLELRPTHDRIRETLFNWLQPYINAAVCLDLFAGSGILGLEALSRGASHVTFVDNQIKVIDSIKQSAQELGLGREQIDLVLGDCLQGSLILSHGLYNIIFLDPPFQNPRFSETISFLESSSLLAENALIYIEKSRRTSLTTFPNWICFKEGHTKNVDYYLFKREANK